MWNQILFLLCIVSASVLIDEDGVATFCSGKTDGSDIWPDLASLIGLRFSPSPTHLRAAYLVKHSASQARLTDSISVRSIITLGG